MSLALKPLLLVFVGGGLGSALRYLVLHSSRLWLPANIPFGTLIVNVAGGLAAGMIAGVLARRGSDGTDAMALFLLTGLLGGFTTFSAFSIDAYLLWQRGEVGAAAGYVAGSVLLSIAAVVAGFAAVRALS